MTRQSRQDFIIAMTFSVALIIGLSILSALGS